MKILYISQSYTVHDRRFADLIANAGYQLGYLRLEGRTDPDPQSGPGGNIAWWRDVQPEGHLDLPALAAAAGSAIKSFAPDLVHAGPMHYGAFLASLTGFHPLVSMSWGSDVLLHAAKHPEVRALVQYALSHSDAVVCDCDAVREELQGYSGKKPRFTQFPWGIEISHFEDTGVGSAVRHRLGYEDSFVVITLRSWQPGYDVDIALESSLCAMREDRRIKLLLAGDGELRPSIIRRISESGMADRICMLGRLSQQDLPKYFAAADLYLSCTPMDGSSVTLMEAMAAGLPAVVTDAGGNREWIRNEVNGWLVREKDVNGYAQAIFRCTGLTQQERRAIADSNHKAIQLRGRWQVNSQRLIALYHELLSVKDAASRHSIESIRDNIII